MEFKKAHISKVWKQNVIFLYIIVNALVSFVTVSITAQTFGSTSAGDDTYCHICNTPQFGKAHSEVRLSTWDCSGLYVWMKIIIKFWLNIFLNMVILSSSNTVVKKYKSNTFSTKYL